MLLHVNHFFQALTSFHQPLSSLNLFYKGWPEPYICMCCHMYGINAPYVTIRRVTSLPKILCIHRIYVCVYVCMVLANPHQIYHHYVTGRVGQNCIYTLYMTVYLVISLPKSTIHDIYIYIPYMIHIYTYIHIYIWFWPTLVTCLHNSVPPHFLCSSPCSPNSMPFSYPCHDHQKAREKKPPPKHALLFIYTAQGPAPHAAPLRAPMHSTCRSVACLLLATTIVSNKTQAFFPKETCLAVQLHRTGPRTACGPFSCSSAQSELNALLQRGPARRCVQHQCIHPLPLLLPLPFPRVFTSAVGLNGDLRVPNGNSSSSSSSRGHSTQLNGAGQPMSSLGETCIADIHSRLSLFFVPGFI